MISVRLSISFTGEEKKRPIVSREEEKASEVRSNQEKKEDKKR